ncbi:hypothetical protein ACK83U_12575 [Rhizobium sp. WW22]|uniref:hypothetical protein n=1 Tax=Rhizobium sp. WW22 TaxID=3389070 RepID=UPI000DD684D8
MGKIKDPVIELLDRYRTAEKEYNDCPETDRPKLDALRDDHTEAMDAITSSSLVPLSQDSALKAIRAALTEEKLMTDQRTITIALLEIGLAYFDDPQGVENRPVNNADNGEKRP